MGSYSLGVHAVIAMVGDCDYRKGAGVTFFEVLIWTGLAGGDEKYCAIGRCEFHTSNGALCASCNPLRQRHQSWSREIVSYTVVARSVGIFHGIPLGAAITTRFVFRAINDKWYHQIFIKWIAPWSLIGLLLHYPGYVCNPG